MPTAMPARPAWSRAPCSALPFFFGLQIMRTGVAPLATQSWFLDAIRATSGSPIFAFAIGAALSVVVQSSVAAIVVMIAFQHTGLFGLPEAIMFVYGANAGSSILMLLLSAKVTGVPKQVALYQVAFNFIGAAILVPLFYVESVSGIPLVRHLIEAITSDSAQQIAFANMIFNTVPVVVLLLSLNPSARILQSASPETKTEQGAKPRYLVDTQAPEPAIAVALIELEQTRLFDLLRAALGDLRQEKRGQDMAENIEAFDSLARVIDDAIADVTDGQPLTAEDYERLDILLRIQHDAKAARDGLSGLGIEIAKLRQAAPTLSFTDSVIEGLDAILQFLADVASERSAEDTELLLQMTSEEGNGTRSVRTAYLAGEHGLSAEDRMHLLAAANYCERHIWLFGEIGRSYRALARFEGATAAK